MSLFRKYGPLKIEERWFSSDAASSDADILYLFQSPASPANSFMSRNETPFPTLHIDLTHEEQFIFSKISSGYRNEIRRALAEDDIEFVDCQEFVPELLDSFISDYLPFCQKKGIESINIDRLRSFIVDRSLYYSAVKISQKIVIWHFYVLFADRGRLLLSVMSSALPNEKRNEAQLGRLNKALHWLDIKYFKSRGSKIYDFGGFTGGDANSALYGVDKFKKSFGGALVIDYNRVIALSILGKMVLSIRDIQALCNRLIQRLLVSKQGIAPRYLVRFDDIHERMNWSVWSQIEDILDAYNIRPLLAIVPQNQDPKLMHSAAPMPDFWEKVRAWEKKGYGIAVHGCHHVYSSKSSGIIGLNQRSEFAGVEFQKQEYLLTKAMDIFHENSVKPHLWIAPAHSFDKNTLAILGKLQVNTVSDGLFMRPCTDKEGRLWIPQQLWKFAKRPFGHWTVCFHHNDWSPNDLKRFRTSIDRFQIKIGTLEEFEKKARERKMSFVDHFEAMAYRWYLLAKRNASKAKSLFKLVFIRPAQVKQISE